MQQYSSSIGSLAAALARAQVELVNPEKSMIATIRAEGKSGGEQSFRYAPLSSGLDIVRKTLGKHEIAAVQATAIDHLAGIVSVTTRLCHSSGEWISSDWPVCSLDDMTSPKRMGAALTYARRYALFSLVGIAGEDDLDAPDLNAPEPAEPIRQKPLLHGRTRHNGRRKYFDRKIALAQDATNSSDGGLKNQLSAVLREQLLSQLKEIGSAEEAATWAHAILAAKNSLNDADARQIEDAFRARLAELESTVDNNSEAQSPAASSMGTHLSSLQHEESGPSRTSFLQKVDKSHLVHPEPRRIRDKDHLRFVIKKPCLICGRTPADAHHLRFVQWRALGRKVSDEFTVPLCRGHHREVHRCGDEAAWWRSAAIDPTAAARALWLETHPLPTVADKNEVETRIFGAPSV